MTIIKRIILAPLVIILFLVLVLFQVNLGVRNTVFSEAYLSDYVGQASPGEKIAEFMFQKLDEIQVEDIAEDHKGLTAEQVAKGQQLLRYYKDLMDGSTDQGWLAEQIDTLLVGVHGYMVNDLDQLPTLDVAPAKDIIKNYYVSQIIAHSDSEAAIRELEVIVGRISRYLGTASAGSYDKEAVIRQVLNIPQLQELNLSESLVEKLVGKVAEMKGGELSVEEIHTYLVEEMINERLKLDTMENELNLQEISTKIYPEDMNPLNEIKNIVGWYKVDFLVLNILTIILLIIMISMLTRDKRSTGILVSRLLLIAGLVVILLGTTTRKTMGSYIMVKDNSDLLYFQDMFQEYISGIFSNFITGGIIYLILGALTLGLIYYAYKKQLAHDSPEPGLGRYPKILIFFICMTVIAGSVIYTARDLHQRVESFRTVIQAEPLKNNNKNILSIVAETLNAEFLNNY